MPIDRTLLPRPPSCARASRWRQGHALRVLRNLDAAGRGRATGRAGSEGMPLLPHQGNGHGSNVVLPSAGFLYH